MYENGKLLPLEKQKHIDFYKMKTKCDAVVLKCGQRNYKDPAFDIGWNNAKEAGLPRGSYWFCDKNESGKSQATLYWSYIKHDIGEGILAADFEQGSWENWNELYNFISELQQLSGLPDEKIAVYTGYYYFMENYPLKPESQKWFSKYPLWIASYTNDPSRVLIPPLWKKSFLWQYNTVVEGLEAGVHSLEIDANYFNGTREEFRKYFSEAPNSNGNDGQVETPTENKSASEVYGVYGSERIKYKEA